MAGQGGRTKRIGVIGGGIAGLAAAHRLVELAGPHQVVLLEAGTRLGGSLDTIAQDGFLIERGADSFVMQPPWAVDLCRRVGLGDQLLTTNERLRRAFVVRGGRLYKLPAGLHLMAASRLWPLMTSPVLSPRGKLRLLAEYFVPRRRDAGDESVAAFARRRLGTEAYERLIQPLAAGIYTADAQRLSMQATMGRFLEMERTHGSLIRAMRRQPRGGASDQLAASGARYELFVAPSAGMSSFVAALAGRLPAGAVRLQTPVDRLQRLADGRWQLIVARRSEPFVQESIDCDEIVVATTATRAASLLREVDPQLATWLGRITYAGSAVVSFGFRREQIAHPLDGFGFVVPAIERRRILAASFSSVKFAARAPEGCVLIRVFVGGASQPELIEQSDADLQTLALDELTDLLGVRGHPLVCDVARWPASMPQYHVGHCELVEQIDSRLQSWPGLILAGAAYRGVGIPHCVHSGELAAQRLVADGTGAKTSTTGSAAPLL